MTGDADEPEREPSWAEVYSTNNCGDCRRPDCPHCTSRFLRYLRDHGTNRATQARGLT